MWFFFFLTKQEKTRLVSLATEQPEFLCLVLYLTHLLSVYPGMTEEPENPFAVPNLKR